MVIPRQDSTYIAFADTLKNAKTTSEFKAYGCMSGFVGYTVKERDVRNKKYPWGYMIMRTSRGYRKYKYTFLKELVDIWKDTLKVWLVWEPTEDYGRIIVRIYDDTPAEWLFMFINMCRHSWEHTDKWPKKKNPAAMEVYLQFIDVNKFHDTYRQDRPYPTQMSHAIWCWRNSTGKKINLTPEEYVGEVFECIQEKDLPYRSTMDNPGGIYLGVPLYKRVVERVAEKKGISLNEGKYDPFAD